MSKLKIVTVPDPRLTQVCQPVKDITARIERLAQDMIDFVLEAGVLGLSAPQVGKLVRVIVVNVDGKPRALLDPVLSNKSLPVFVEEGCLSEPNRTMLRSRFRKLHYKAFDLSGAKVEADAEDLLAVVLQHEVDHLDGALMHVAPPI